MDTSLYSQLPAFRSRLSFKPFIRTLEKFAASTEPELQICQELVREFNAIPDLMEAIDDYEILQTHSQLIEKAIATIFPAMIHVKERLNAIATPFSNKVIHASPPFRKSFMNERSHLAPFDAKVATNITQGRIHLAYKMILKEFYNIDLNGGYSFICAYPDPADDRIDYFELQWDSQFVSVTACIPLPELPGGFNLRCHHVEDLTFYPELRHLLPLEEFIFEGILPIEIRNVTERESLRQVQLVLEHEEAMDSPETLSRLKEQFHFLLQTDIHDIGITSFRTDTLSERIIAQPLSRMLRHIKSIKERNALFGLLIRYMELQGFLSVAKEEAHEHAARLFSETAARHALLIPLFRDGRIAGCLEIYTLKPLQKTYALIAKLKAVTPFLEASLLQKEHLFRNQVEQLVKDHFTALQPSVEWKFHQAAIKFLADSQENKTAKMESIEFEEVHPLYAAIDIKNSSNERNSCAQQDLSTQLVWAKEILQAAQQIRTFPLLEELLSEIEENIHLLANHLISSDEQSVHLLLKNEIEGLLEQLPQIIPELGTPVEAYRTALDPVSRVISKQQKAFEESISAVNHYLSEFIDREQPAAQSLFPHYFERFVTDGVDFSMYIGQSITPKQKFTSFYFKNLCLWQLKTVVLAAQNFLDLIQPGLSLPLETTQLILVYGHPISIRFRTAERKFDIDAAHARYEVVKKRVDKAYIKKTNERLTKPGTVVIVYFNEKDAIEYTRYINFLKKESFLEGKIERLELEEMQGVIGLKALRVAIRSKRNLKEEHPGKETKIKETPKQAEG